MFFTVFDNFFNLSVLRLPERVTLAFSHLSVFRLALVWTRDVFYCVLSQPAAQSTPGVRQGR